MDGVKSPKVARKRQKSVLLQEENINSQNSSCEVMMNPTPHVATRLDILRTKNDDRAVTSCEELAATTTTSSVNNNVSHRQRRNWSTKTSKNAFFNTITTTTSTPYYHNFYHILVLVLLAFAHCAGKKC